MISDPLEARIAKLERQTTRLKILLFVSLVGAISIAAAAGTVAAQTYTSYHNSSGTVRLSADGLYIYDANGIARLSMYISDTGKPVIRFKDHLNKARIFFGETGTGDTPRIQFNDGSENERLYVGLTTQATGQFQTFSSGGEKMSSIDDDQLRITDDSAVQRIYLGISDSNDTFLRMYGPDKNIRLYAGIYSDGHSGFAAYDATGTNTWSSP